MPVFPTAAAALPVAHAAAALPVAAKRESRIIVSTFHRATINNRKLLPPKGIHNHRSDILGNLSRHCQPIPSKKFRGYLGGMDTFPQFAQRAITWTPVGLPRQCRLVKTGRSRPITATQKPVEPIMDNPDVPPAIHVQSDRDLEMDYAICSIGPITMTVTSELVDEFSSGTRKLVARSALIRDKGDFPAQCATKAFPGTSSRRRRAADQRRRPAFRPHSAASW